MSVNTAQGQVYPTDAFKGETVQKVYQNTTAGIRSTLGNSSNGSLPSYNDTLTQDYSAFFLSSPNVYIIFGVIFFLLIVLKVFKSKSKSRNRIVLIGQRFSGKTQLFMKLNGGKVFPSVPSISNNLSHIKLNNRQYQMTDYFGDDFSKEELIQNIPSVHCIVHVVDGTDSEKLPQVATLIYRILVNAKFQRTPCSYILFLNKNDSAQYLGSSKIEKKLEDQIQQIKASRRNLAEQKQGQQDYLKMSTSRFELNKTDIKVIAGSAQNDVAELSSLLQNI